MEGSKLELKNKLTKDRNDLLMKIAEAKDEFEKQSLEAQLKLVDSYILICIRRKRF